MPRARNTTDAEIRDLVAKIQVFTEPNYVNRSDFRQSNLDALRAFPDKALKAFYVRKILKIPGSIGAEVFGITTALISQAEATEVTVSRSGRERQPNAYSAANRSEDVSGGFFRKSTTSYERFGFGVTNVDRLFIFTNFARLAIVNNRGADVVSFQPRMVASYMAESDALNFKNVTLPNWRDEVALVMGGQDAPSSVGAAQPEATASQPEISGGLQYRRTARRPLNPIEREESIRELIAAGADRDQATRLVEELLDLGFNFKTPSRSGNELSYRLFYYGPTSGSPSSADVVAKFFTVLRLSPVDVTMGLRGEDLAGTITFSRQSAATPPSEPESTATPVLEYTRLMREVGYPEMFATELLGDLNGAEVEILSANSIFDGQGLDVFVQSRNTDVIGLRSLIRANWNQLGVNQGVTTQGFPSVNVLDPNRYVIRIGPPSSYRLEAESGSTQSAEPQSTTSTASTSTATAPVQEEVDTTYDGIETRYPNLISRVDYTTIRNSGYSRNQARSLLDFINSYGLRIMSISVRSGVRRLPYFLRINVRGVNSSARSFRNTTFLRFLRGMRSVAEDSAVQVLSPNGRFYQSATFRGTGRGQTPVGALIIPIYSEQTQAAASAPQATSTPQVTSAPQASSTPQASQEIDPQGDPGVAGESNPTASTAPPTRTRTRNVKLNRSIGIEIEGDMPFAREAGMSITDYFKLRMRQWCAENGQPQLKVGEGKDKYTFGRDGSVRGKVPFEVDSPALVPANIDPATTSLPASFIEANKFVSDQVLWNQIRTFCESLRYSGVRIHKSAGLHIHISVADYTREDFERYVYNSASLEPLIDLAMAANSRGPGRSYSGSLVTEGRITTGYLKGNRVRGGTPEEAARRAMSIGREKIRTTTGIQTIEFRHPMTTIDYDDIKNFTLLHFYLVTVSKRKKLQRTNFKGLMNILPVDVATYFYNRIELMDMKPPTYDFFTGTDGQDTALKKAGDTSDGVRGANLPREDYT